MVKKKMIENDGTKNSTKIVVIMMILVMLFFTSIVFATIIGIFIAVDDESVASGNVAIIPVHGVITTSSPGGFSSDGAVSGDIVKYIEKADKNDMIKAIVVEINSPGGSPVASDEIGNALSKTSKPTIALIRELGASGGYWVASSTDHIIANRMSLTGSIGVIGSYLEFDGLLNDYNVSYRRYVAGRYKDIGSPLKEASSAEQVLFQQKLDLLHDYFLEQVQSNRNLSDDQLNEISSGIFYLGVEAYDLGLVDELGNMDSVNMYLNQTYNISAEYVIYKKSVTFFDQLFGVLNNVGFSMGKGLGSSVMEKDSTISIRY